MTEPVERHLADVLGARTWRRVHGTETLIPAPAAGHEAAALA
jgi:hypothetical protein